MNMSIEEGFLISEEKSLEEKIGLIKSIKNEIIGSLHMKNIYYQTGILNQLVLILSQEEDGELLCQTIATLGSFMHGCKEALEYLKQYMRLFSDIHKIFKNNTQNKQIVDICLRTLRISIANQVIKINDFLQSDIFEDFAKVMNTEVNVMIISEIISLCGTSSFYRRKIFEHKDVITILIDFIDQAKFYQCQYAIFDALSKVTTEYEELCRAILDNTEIFKTLSLFIRHPSEKVRLSIAQLLTNLNKFYKFPMTQMHLLKWLIPGLIKSLKSHEFSVKIETASILTTLVGSSEELQRIGGDLGGIEELCKILESIHQSEEEKKEGEEDEEEEPMQIEGSGRRKKSKAKAGKKSRQLKSPSIEMPGKDQNEHPLLFDENSLSSLSQHHSLMYHSLAALAAMTAAQETCRKKLLESQCLTLIIQLFKNKEPRIRAAACLCIVSLTRSEKIIKVVLMKEEIQTHIVKLLNDSYLEVQIHAASAICNLALEFQQILTETPTIVTRLTELTQSKHTSLRYKSLCAIKNLLFTATKDLKHTIMNKLTYSRLYVLLDDEEYFIQEQALSVFRNLLFKNPEDIQDVLSQANSATLIKKIGEKLLSSNAQVLLQAIYVLCNIASGNEKQKSLLLDQTILKTILSLLQNANKEVKLGVINFLVNLLWKGESGREKRKKALHDLDFEAKLLEIIQTHQDALVVNNAKKALQNFKE